MASWRDTQGEEALIPPTRLPPDLDSPAPTRMVQHHRISHRRLVIQRPPTAIFGPISVPTPLAMSVSGEMQLTRVTGCQRSSSDVRHDCPPSTQTFLRY